MRTDQTTCVDDLDIVINGSVSGASNAGIWSTTGTGAFTNANTVLANIYQASAQDSLAQGVDLILAATNTGVCRRRPTRCTWTSSLTAR
jgi:hypothetical protein